MHTYVHYKYVQAASQKVKHRITIWPNNSTPREIKTYIHTETCLKKYIAALYNIYFENSQKVETTQMSIDECKNKWRYIHAMVS